MAVIFLLFSCVVVIKIVYVNISTYVNISVNMSTY